MPGPVRWLTPCAMLLVIVVLRSILFVASIEVGRRVHPERIAEETSFESLALYGVIKNAVVFVVLLAVLRRVDAGASVTLRLKRVSATRVTVACLMILSLVPWDRYLNSQFGAGQEMVAPQDPHFNVALVVSWISLVLLTPVAEELFFRGFTLTVFGRKSCIVGVIGSCALFGFYHFSGSVASLVIPLPFALATAYSVVLTGSVYPAIVAHALWNLLAAGSDAGYVVLEPTGGRLFGSAVVGFTCAGLLLRMNRRHRSGAPSRR